MVFTKKNIRIVINHIPTEVLNICSIICQQIAVLRLRALRQQRTVNSYVLHHSKYTAICSIDAVADGFDRFDLYFHFEIDNLPSC